MDAATAAVVAAVAVDAAVAAVDAATAAADAAAADAAAEASDVQARWLYPRGYRSESPRRHAGRQAIEVICAVMGTNMRAVKRAI